MSCPKRPLERRLMAHSDLTGSVVNAVTAALAEGLTTADVIAALQRVIEILEADE